MLESHTESVTLRERTVDTFLIVEKAASVIKISDLGALLLDKFV